MKKCIWCKRADNETEFRRKAHTVPQQLGGEDICENVCDQCNAYFGRTSKSLPPIETVLKETFNISRAVFLHSNREFGKNKTQAKFSSIYFNVDFNSHAISVKQKYKLHRQFQENVCRQLKRGLYKLFLEERERQFQDSHEPSYDFIREFARYNIGDYPIFYFERKFGIILLNMELVRHPKLLFENDYQFKYLLAEHGFFEFEFLSHVFGIPVIRTWELAVSDYLRMSMDRKKEIFKHVKQVVKFNDVDLALSIMADKRR